MNNHRNEEIEIDLVELFFFLARKWKQLLLGVIIGAIIFGGYTYMKTPVYKSESMLYILSKTTSITSVADLQLGNALSNDFVVIATSKPVIDTAVETVAEKSGIQLTRKEAQRMISVANKTDTRLLVITVTSEDAKLACDLANAVTEATATQMAEITKSDPPTTVERAEVAAMPEAKGTTKNGVLGAIIGLLVVAAIYTVILLSNDRIKTPDDVERYLESSVLVSIPLDKEQDYQARQRKKRAKRK